MSRSLLVIILILSLLNLTAIVVAQAETQDLAVVSVTPSTTEAEVGDLVNITVVVRNQGTASETFNVTTYYDTNVVETKTVLDLNPNTNVSLTFAWNTTSVLAGVYNIRAEADTLPEETATGDNRLTSFEGVIVFESPYIAVDPGSTVNPALTLGINYTISIYTDYSGGDVWGYQFEMTFNPNILEGIAVVNGDLITEADGPTMWNLGTFNNTEGKLSLTGNGFFSLPPSPLPVTSGPGIMANITFKVVGLGDSYITLGDETKLIGYDTIQQINFNIIDKVYPSPGHILGGYFRNTGEVIHDIAVVSVKPSTTGVDEGELLNVTVVVENEGTVNEDATVEVYRDYIPGKTFWRIGKRSENLVVGEIKSLVFVWNTTDAPLGDHTLTAVAIRLPGENDVGNNILESEEIVTIRIIGETPIPIFFILGIAIVAVAAIALIWYVLKRGARTP